MHPVCNSFHGNRGMYLILSPPIHQCMRISSCTGRQFFSRRAYSHAASSTVDCAARDPRYSQVSHDDLNFFREQLGRSSAVIDNLSGGRHDDIENFNVDWMHKYRGSSRLVLKPQNKDQVSQILRYCNERKLAVVPQGGNTGLVGGSVPVFDEIVISTMDMNKIRSFNPMSGILTADAGVILEIANQYLEDHGYIFPLDLGAKGSCHIGGNIATNAGGLRVLRYGSLSANVLGIEAVLPDGTIIDSLSSLRKDNTGYALKQLFIGSEGTLGIVTGVSILCPPKPKAIHVAYLGLKSYEDVCKTFSEAKTYLSEILSAFEMMDGASQKLVRRLDSIQYPLQEEYPFYCIVETSGSRGEHDAAKMEDFLEQLMSAGVVADGVLAQGELQARNIWRMREDIAEVINSMGGTYKYDVSIPMSKWYQLVEDCRHRLQQLGLLASHTHESSVVNTVVGYGHIGDFNLHLNVSVKEYIPEIRDALEPWIYEWVQKNHGSISAEHGLGQAKKPFIQLAQTETNLGLMKQIRDMYDPNGIMNPYKFI